MRTLRGDLEEVLTDEGGCRTCVVIIPPLLIAAFDY